MAKKPTKREARMERESVLWHALAKHGGKQGDRDLLVAGQRYEIEATVSGTVDGDPVCFPLLGALIVNHDVLKASSSGPGAEKVLACALARLPKATRKKFVDEFTADEIAGVDQEIVKQCTHLLTRLRTVTTQNSRGAVRYEPAHLPPADEAAAKAA